MNDATAEDGAGFPGMTGESRPTSFHEAIVHNHSKGTFAIRKGSFKLTVSGPRTIAQVLDDVIPVSFALHDLSKDIGETVDVSGQHPERVKAMHALLKRYVRERRKNGVTR